MKSWILGFVVLSILAACVAALILMRGQQGTVREVELPSHKTISLSGKAYTLAEVFQAIKLQAGIDGELPKSRNDLGETKVVVPTTKLPLWTFLGELSVSNNLVFYFKNGLTAGSAKGESLAYATSGPALIVLRSESTGRPSVGRELSLSLHFHPRELAEPEITHSTIVSNSGKATDAKWTLAAKDEGLVAWNLDNQDALPAELGKIVCTIEAKVRTELIELSLPFAKKSRVDFRDLAVRWVGSEHPTPSELLQKYEASWSSGLAPDAERRVSDIMRREVDGTRPSDEELAWFRGESPNYRRFVAVNGEGAFDAAGKQATSTAFVYVSDDASHAAFTISGNEEKLADASFRGTFGFERGQNLEFVIKVPAR